MGGHGDESQMYDPKLLGFIRLAGVLALCLGVFVAMPVCTFAYIALYDEISGIHHLREAWPISEGFDISDSGW